MKRSIILVVATLFLASGFATMAQDKISLNGTWNLEFWEQESQAVTDPAEVASLKTTKLSATVPGNVELDLLAAGMIKNPEIGK